MGGVLYTRIGLLFCLTIDVPSGTVSSTKMYFETVPENTRGLFGDFVLLSSSRQDCFILVFTGIADSLRGRDFQVIGGNAFGC